MSIAERAIRRPITTLMMFVCAVVVGIAAARLLPLEQFPELDIPFVGIQLPYPGATPEEVERLLARPAEEVLATLSGIKRMNSESRSDGATVFMEFDWGADVGIRAVEAREKIESIRDQLPGDLRRINVFKFNTTDQPVLTIRISSERDLSNAYDLLDRNLKRPLERVPGVGRVNLYGVEPKELRIELISDRVAAHNVDLIELAQQLRESNFSASAGLITDGETRFQVNPQGEFRSLEQVQNLVIDQNGLRLSDIAHVSFGQARRDYARHLHRNYAIGLDIFKERGANLVEVGDEALALIDEISTEPEMQGIELFFLENQAESVTSSLTHLLSSGILGAILSLLVLYFFLRNFATTLMVSLAVPISLTVTLGAMYFLGISLNILSMMGLLLAVGMLVDNAVVVTESIFREREKDPDNPTAAASRGVGMVAMAVTAGTFTSAIVFLPNIFGEQNQISIFMTHVAVAICISLLASLVIARTVIPLLASRLMPPPSGKKTRFIDGLKNRYSRFLGWTLRHRWKSAFMLLGFIIVGVAPMALQLVETDMFPADDQRRLFMRYNLDRDYSLDKIKPSVDRIEDYLYENQEQFEIRAVYSYYDENGEAQSSILLTDDDEAIKPPSEIKEMIREGMPKIAIGQPTFDQNRTAGGEGVRISLVGESYEQLAVLAPDVERILSQVEGLNDVRAQIQAGDQEVRVRVDRERASRFGFTTEAVANVISIALRGVELNEYRGPRGEIAMRLEMQDQDSQNIEQLADLKITAPDGRRIPLASLVDFEVGRGAMTIERDDRETSLGITATLDEITMDEARERIDKAMESISLPPGYRWDYGRGFDRENEAMQKMMQNIFLAIALIFLVLAALFESMLYPISIITCILFSVFGVFWFFALTGTVFSLMAMIGILILIGVVVNNGIVLVDHINQLRREGFDRYDAIVQGGRDRLRPILMTVGTTVLGLLPLCFGTEGIGGGGPPYFPMARAIVGGLLFSTLISLLVLPTIYIMLDDTRHWSRRVLTRALGTGLVGRARKRRADAAEAP